MQYDPPTASAGTASGIGFYELATSYRNFGFIMVQVPRIANDYDQVEGKVNSVTNPTVVTLKTELVDATDNVIDAAATGTLTLTVEDTPTMQMVVDLVSLYQQTVWVTLQALINRQGRSNRGDDICGLNQRTKPYV